MAKHLKLLILILIILTTGVFLVFSLQKYQNSSLKKELVTLPNIVEAQVLELTQESADGKELLTIKKETNATTTTYSFRTKKGVFYSMTLPLTNSISIPFNTWSPDNKYFFIKEDGTEDIFYVITPKGESINVAEKFKEKYPEYKLMDATGWAADTLLILNTNKIDNSNGPSIWFDVARGSFIALSTRFD